MRSRPWFVRALFASLTLLLGALSAALVGGVPGLVRAGPPEDGLVGSGRGAGEQLAQQRPSPQLNPPAAGGNTAPVIPHAPAVPASAPTPVGPSAPDSPALQTPAVADALRLGDAISTVAEHVSPAVVSIRIEAMRAPRGRSPFDPFGGNGDTDVVQGSGSGVIISADGAILTNNHVVENATRLEVVMKDGRRFVARLVGRDPATDLAVIRVAAQNLPAARLSTADPRVGEWVVAIGSPFGLDYTVTAGVLSAVGRAGLGMNEIEDYLQTDASINPGNSGGPLVNLRGEVLGINTMIVGRGTGIGFAVPASIAQNVAEQLLATGVVRRSWIGVGFQPLTPELAASFGTELRGGALISHLSPNGPAARAGVEPGDIVQAIDGVPVRDDRELLRSVLRHAVGARVRLEVLRRGQRQTLELTTGERPGQDGRAAPPPMNPPVPPPQRTWGLGLQPLTPMQARQMGYAGAGRVLITGVLEGSYADRAGLRQWDVIVEADHAPVVGPQQLEAALQDGRALLRVERRDGAFYTVIARE